jgi:hypothetical protein
MGAHAPLIVQKDVYNQTIDLENYVYFRENFET